MKKIITLIFLGLITGSINMLGMENEQDASKPTETIQFTKKDWAKLGAASIGTLFFAAATLRTTAMPSILGLSTPKKDIEKLDIPAAIMAIPLCGILPRLVNAQTDTGFCYSMLGLTGITSVSLTGFLATYVGKKLYQWKQARTFKASENRT